MVPNFLHEYSVQILLYNIQSPFDLKSYKRLPEIKKKKKKLLYVHFTNLTFIDKYSLLNCHTSFYKLYCMISNLVLAIGYNKSEVILG